MCKDSLSVDYTDGLNFVFFLLCDVCGYASLLTFYRHFWEH